MKHYLEPIVEEVSNVLKDVSLNELNNLVNMIHKDSRIFVDGEGRSGFAGKGFAMRLMHLGYEVYVMGETITPSFQEQDVFVCISGSGNTKSVYLNAEKAKKADAKVVTITNNSDSSLGNLSDQVIKLNATVRGDTQNRKSIQLLGSLFDQSAHLLLDSVCLSLSKRDDISNEEATKKHV